MHIDLIFNLSPGPALSIKDEQFKIKAKPRYKIKQTQEEQKRQCSRTFMYYWSALKQDNEPQVATDDQASALHGNSTTISVCVFVWTGE